LTRRGNFFQTCPEAVLKADAGLVLSEDDASFDDRGPHAAPDPNMSETSTGRVNPAEAHWAAGGNKEAAQHRANGPLSSGFLGVRDRRNKNSRGTLALVGIGRWRCPEVF